MSESTEELSGRELDEAVAVRVMETPLRSDGTPWPGDVWPYSSNIEAARRVEDRIAELGLQSAYYRALLDIVANSISDRLFHHFDLIHASAEQRSRAALAAMEQKS